ncbi:hypothetical protein MLD38_026817 [Melastoma candidum]|uniref:Uncharacterized protein n=1 Tax=Melastoma candidum TaxID=119954 RepID=A0ACB9NZI9_9MYRT|nr:hypothetical protein MLD38_026817 [Melastoma candidum]
MAAFSPPRLLILLTGFATAIMIVVGGPDVTTIHLLCNPHGRSVPFLDRFPSIVIHDLIEGTPDAPEHKLYMKEESSYYYGTLYGRAKCSAALNRDECLLCLEDAAGNIEATCGLFRRGARIELRDCYMRYEEYPFPPM